jgi:hypothetical protein
MSQHCSLLSFRAERSSFFLCPTLWGAGRRTEELWAITRILRDESLALVRSFSDVGKGRNVRSPTH